MLPADRASQNSPSLGRLVCARAGKATQVEMPISAARRVTLIPIAILRTRRANADRGILKISGGCVRLVAPAAGGVVGVIAAEGVVTAGVCAGAVAGLAAPAGAPDGPPGEVAAEGAVARHLQQADFARTERKARVHEHRQKWNAKSGVEIHFLSSGAQRLPASVNASAGLHAAQ
jgi:hypothetical protein